ncbi:MAG: arginine--tRNA ligase [Acidimicrobiia bacterium]|nr:arginine--tRNA ligase [Acidimicrobiia bacterium]
MSTIENALVRALHSAGVDPEGAIIEITTPARPEHGDAATNIALQVAKKGGVPPRDLAEKIAEALREDASDLFTRVEVAGPGFLNFFFSPSHWHEVLRAVLLAEGRYGHSDLLRGQKINLEFVSANPTGPLHAGGGRWVAVGDALANLLASQGAEVHREYYLNDLGAQLEKFGESLLARYEDREPPEDGYQGDYVIEMARRMRADIGNEVTQEQAREWGYRDVVEHLRDDLGRIGVVFDTWFSERTLHERGDTEKVLETLRSKGATFIADGAEWLRTSDFGDQRDRVLIKSDGSTTYLCNDLAYHQDKVARGWNYLIDIWGADHHGQVKSLQAGLEALGQPADQPEVLLGQLVKLVRGGEPVRLSKRAGDVITLADILDEVDADVARLTFLLQGIDSPQTFDLDVVTAQSAENPVYYVQYAHARIASIGRRAESEGIKRIPFLDVNLSPLSDTHELDLLRSLAELPAVLSEAAQLRAPHRVTTWVRDLAARFHAFYRACRVITDDVALTQARLALAEATRIGLKNGLDILGVKAPDAMHRSEREDEDDL